MSTIDGKYKILAVNPCTGNHHTEKDGVFFCVHDASFLDILRGYPDACRQRGCDEGQILGAERLLERVIKWQAQNGDKVKTPDVSNDCELDHVINPDG